MEARENEKQMRDKDDKGAWATAFEFNLGLEHGGKR